MKLLQSYTYHFAGFLVGVWLKDFVYASADNAVLLELTKQDWGTPVTHYSATDGVFCSYYNPNNEKKFRFIKCKKKTYSCFNMYHTSWNDQWPPRIEVAKKGCLPDSLADSIQGSCSHSKCLLPNTKPIDFMDSKKKFLNFCCCTGSTCNSGTPKHVLTTPNTTHPTHSPAKSTSSSSNNNNTTLVLTMVISITTLVFFILCLILLYCWKRKQTKTLNSNKNARVVYSERRSDCSSLSIDTETLDTLLHGNLIHQGMHSAIRLGRLNGSTVAVKILPPRSKKQWYNEKEIYRMLKTHPNIAKFVTCNNFHDGISFEGVIVMSYYPQGSLLNYLRHHVLSWKHLIRLAYSVANGLAFLHGKGENDTGHQSHPGIAHLDLNSRNILVKADGTCVLADFGFAQVLSGKPPQNFRSVGSPRYMAPEVLDGSIVLTNWTTALKQVDCYALGLVLWELARRCHEICKPDSIVPECMLPYEEELGNRPSVNKVKQFVCINNERPKFPVQWKTNDFVISQLKTMITECLDLEGDARLTALCVLNRISQLQDTSSAEQLIYQETSNNDQRIFIDEEFSEKPKRISDSDSVLYVDAAYDVDDVSVVSDDEMHMTEPTSHLLSVSKSGENMV